MRVVVLVTNLDDHVAHLGVHLDSVQRVASVLGLLHESDLHDGQPVLLLQVFLTSLVLQVSYITPVVELIHQLVDEHGVGEVHARHTPPLEILTRVKIGLKLIP